MEHQCIVSIVPSKKNEVFVFAGGELRCFSSPALAAKGLEIIAGRNIDEWLAGIDEKKRSAVEKRLEFFHQLEGNKTLIFGIMGGSGQALFMRAADLGLDVRRIPISRLYALTQVEPKSSPGERCEAITNAWGQDESAFYPLAPIDPSILLARGLARERLGIQDLRKPMQLRFHAGLRDAQYILPVESEGLISLIKKAVKDLFHNRKLVEQIAGALESLRALLPSSFQQRLQGVMGHYAQPRFIVAAKEEEEKLEKYILELIGDLPIWKTLHANGNSKLPGVKGLGPALGGVIIGEIGDIRRFPSASDLRSYARFGLKDGFFPKRKAGEELSCNLHLYQAMWFWSTDQVARYEHVWRDLYYWKKARELQAHPDVVARIIKDRKGRDRTMYDFTLKHLDSRAKRWTGSQLFNYIWDLWTALEAGRDAEGWYVSSRWPEYMVRVDSELVGGLRAYLEEEIPKRRRGEPEEESEEEIEF
ncbi:MAG: hypothetical protein A3J55_03880 [Candidatus Ryanbacteria bacterium RIFCSPHIGHO2_02_FULL_45_17b]|uniref:Uncharacterized protein n=1 Tax=Candidatus Ryanbacteria bacterium RIFCSPHIGHO2_01_FULL_45_22 TaxID=1802114 RepID=A0A1G2FXI0_9BACT|nr:MAG: hypothetical protein A2719_02020 [Candidatus Ryanbacteria bacterium RIFCSPHIGHO2_01_FULL_45_22]OGZ46420.1 MAG: hypothetical protein A3J55_03880 [Candidatus Ryanbacteria bacterium RIFCSPHIGHO2_02_FULL_45_17b]